MTNRLTISRSEDSTTCIAHGVSTKSLPYDHIIRHNNLTIQTFHRATSATLTNKPAASSDWTRATQCLSLQDHTGGKSPARFKSAPPTTSSSRTEVSPRPWADLGLETMLTLTPLESVSGHRPLRSAACIYIRPAPTRSPWAASKQTPTTPLTHA